LFTIPTSGETPSFGGGLLFRRDMRRKFLEEEEFVLPVVALDVRIIDQG
jgi:hypothetical protein